MRLLTRYYRPVFPHPSNPFPEEMIGRKVAIYVAASYVAVFCTLMTCSAMANGPILTRSVTLEAGYYSDDSNTWYIDTQLGLSSDYWIYLAAQKNNEGSEHGFDLDSQSYFAGFGSNPEAEWSYDLIYENWGNPGDIDTDALRAIITWTRGSWAYSIMPQYREIDLAGIDNDDPFSFNERGLGGGVLYSGFEDWELYLEWYEYRFSKDPAFLENTSETDSLSLTATSLAQGLYDQEMVMGIGSWLNLIYIALQYTQGKSAIDNSLVQTTEAHVDYYLSDMVTPYLRIGRASSPGFSPLWFGNFGLQFSW